MEPIRLNKYLSEKGICSRREADALTEAGQITVNGLPAVMGQKVTDKDDIKIRGRSINKKKPEKVILAVNKPVGVVCTTRSFPGEENIIEMVDYESRLYPVGRLDKDSQGLIFLTNDGAFAEEVTRAAGNHEKEYEVTVNKAVTEEFIRRLSKGIYLKDLNRRTKSCKVLASGERKFRITLTQGLNRQIRRMCETCGYEVVTLKRIRIMNVELGNLKERAFRKLEGPELKALLRQLKA
ncbi:MAG: pseudouridine synthase [Lachnospiraceae bacterium]|nr:pseudouridine synthase [Lachnospiraceae bacterium]